MRGVPNRSLWCIMKMADECVQGNGPAAGGSGGRRESFGLLGPAMFLLTGCATVVPAPELDGLRQRLVADCVAGLFSGVVAVKKDERIVFLHSCGHSDVERRAPIRPDARYKLFSTSKPLTATAVLKLVELGRMELEAPLRAYVPDVPAEWGSITIRQLLQHRSGVPELTEKLLDTYRQGSRSHEQAMAHLLGSLSEEEKKLSGAPGQGWRYSNFSYELLALAAARAGRAPFDRVLHKLVFAPAGMRTANVELIEAKGEMEAAPSPGLVRGFAGTPADLRPALSYSFVQQGAGAVHASYEDLMAFDKALSRGRLLSPAMQARMETEAVSVNDGVRYGYGWMIRSVGPCTYWQHSGGNNGYTSEFARAPDARVAIVVLSNLEFAKVGEIRSMAMKAMLESPENSRRCVEGA